MNDTGAPRAQWLRAALAAALLLPAALAAAPPPVEHFTRRPAIESVSLSPSGRRLALVVPDQRGRGVLSVMDLDPIGPQRVVAAFEDADVGSVRWVNDERLVYEASARGALIREGHAGTFAVDHDGGQRRQLIAWQHAAVETGTSIASRVLPYGWSLHRTLDDGGSEVFVQRRVMDGHDLRRIEVARLDTRSGQLRPLDVRVPDGVRGWLFDARHEPRLLTVRRDGRWKFLWRRPGTDTWEEVADFDVLEEGLAWPLLVDDSGAILVSAARRGDTIALHRFDPAAKRFDDEPLAAVAGFDLRPRLERDPASGRLLGLHFTADAPMSHWFDAGLQRLQRGIDAALPGRSNRLFCGRCATTRHFVVHSRSDRQPGQLFLFDRAQAALQPIGSTRPWIDEATQGRRSLHRVPTRDGLSMPLYVTHPAGAAADAALPAVVLVHGGPWVRGHDLDWDADAQFLASRGYRVLQPEFRGSEGYGRAWAAAGRRQWGRAMQDDLADAVRWAAAQKLVDPAKVCVMGASYGGYAALMAPISHPQTFRCAISFAGVTDIEAMFDITWSDFSDTFRREGMPALIGDPQKDAERMAQVSPLKRVAEIKVPLLLAHGAADQRVPIDHWRRFESAARAAGVPIEAVAYTGEGHGFFDPANRVDFLGRVERLLERTLRGR